MKDYIKNLIRRILWILHHNEYGQLDKSAKLGRHVTIYNKKNLFMDQLTNIDRGAIIMNTNARFIMKSYSGAAIGLTVITGNHISPLGMWRKIVTEKVKQEIGGNDIYDKDIIVEEDVWLGANVTLLAGAKIGRGAIVGAGSVVRTKVPPYSIVTGNPAKVMGFVFDPEQTIEHEAILYPESMRLSREVLEKNYHNYYKKRIKRIVEYQKI